MNKLVIVAGSPNSGKTTTTKIVISKLIERGYSKTSLEGSNLPNAINDKEEQHKNEFVVLEKDNTKIAVITFGDIVAQIDNVIKQINLDNINCLVCCSHATRGKKVFEYFHDFIGKINIKKVKILPIYKNLICRHNRENEENEQLSQIIVDWID